MKHLSTLRKRKRSDFLSSGERNGNSLNRGRVKAHKRCVPGVVGLVRTVLWNSRRVKKFYPELNSVEKLTKEGDSPVNKRRIVNKYREGKLKSTPVRGVK